MIRMAVKKKSSGSSPQKKKPKLGSGERFKQLKSKLAKKGAKDPGALAAWIGRKKYGKKKMGAISGKGRSRAAKKK